MAEAVTINYCDLLSERLTEMLGGAACGPIRYERETVIRPEGPCYRHVCWRKRRADGKIFWAESHELMIDHRRENPRVARET